MILSGVKEARGIGAEAASRLSSGAVAEVHLAFRPILTDKNPFRLLDILGAALAASPREHLFPLLDRVAEDASEGGWVLIASALRPLMDQDPRTVFTLCRRYIIKADIWYAADIFGERVPGPFLCAYFDRALDILTDWRDDQNAWVRRAVGVAVHFWAKRTKSQPSRIDAARRLFNFLDPLLDEKDIRAAKGIGWGLKTLGRYYPQQASAFLTDAFIHRGRQPLAVVRRKALTWLPEDMKSTLRRK